MMEKINENVNLSDDEKKYLWSKLEYNKKKTATSTENELFKLLNSDKTNFNEDEFNKILGSLEYSFKKKLSKQDTPLTNSNFISISEKIPETWLGVKYSSLTAKKKREEKVPTEKDTKTHILSYLDFNKINYDKNLSKEELLKLIDNKDK